MISLTGAGSALTSTPSAASPAPGSPPASIVVTADGIFAAAAAAAASTFGIRTQPSGGVIRSFFHTAGGADGATAEPVPDPDPSAAAFPHAASASPITAINP